MVEVGLVGSLSFYGDPYGKFRKKGFDAFDRWPTLQWVVGKTADVGGNGVGKPGLVRPLPDCVTAKTIAFPNGEFGNEGRDTGGLSGYDRDRASSGRLTNLSQSVDTYRLLLAFELAFAEVDQVFSFRQKGAEIGGEQHLLV